MYEMPTWKNPGRRRIIGLSHDDPSYCWYYDLDDVEFTDLVVKLKNDERLSEGENDRYGKYIYTIIFIALGNPKFSKKSHEERAALFEQAVYELLTGITTFSPNRGRLYSYAYRIAYTSFCHYYANAAEETKRSTSIREHCEEELEYYYDEFRDHKVPRH